MILDWLIGVFKWLSVSILRWLRSCSSFPSSRLSCLPHLAGSSRLRARLKSFQRLLGSHLRLCSSLLLCLALSVGICSVSPRVAYAEITLTPWSVFYTSMQGLGFVADAWSTANAAECLQHLRAQISTLNTDAGTCKRIATELQSATGYTITSGTSGIVTVYGRTGSTEYATVRQCADCVGGYNYVDGQQVTCSTCDGTGTTYWTYVPYSATIECCQELSEWIRYLTDTQTDWSTDAGQTSSSSEGTTGDETGGDSGGTSYVAIDSVDLLPNSYTNNIKIWKNYPSAWNTSIGTNYKTLYISGTNTGYTYFQSIDGIVLGSELKTVINQYCSDGWVAVITMPQNFYLAYNSSGTYRSANGYLYLFCPNTVVNENKIEKQQGDNTVLMAGNNISVTYGEAVNGVTCYRQTICLFGDSSGTYLNFRNTSDSLSSSSFNNGFSLYWISGSYSASSSTGDSGGTTVNNTYNDYGDTSSTTNNVTNNTSTTNNTTTTYDETNNTYNTTNNYTTTTDVDVSAITSRQDALNRMVSQLGLDLESYFTELDNELTGWWDKLFTWLSRIYNRLGNMLYKLEDLETAFVGSHGLDLLGVFGRLDNILTALDDMTFDLSMPEFDDTELLAAIGEVRSDMVDWFDQIDADLLMLSQQLNDILSAIRSRRTYTPDVTLPSLEADENGIVPYEDVLNLTALRDALTRLMQKFPFSEANKVLQVAAMLVRPAQAPSGDFPIGNLNDPDNPWLVHFDLSQFDSVASLVRVGILLWMMLRVSTRSVRLWTSQMNGGDD